MQRSLFAAILGTPLVVAVCLGVYARSSAQPPAAPAPTGAAPRESAGEEKLDVRYAKAYVALAEANLKRAQRTNQRLAKTVSADVLLQFHEDLQVARLELQTATRGDHEFEVWLRRAEASFRAADAQWKSTLAANQAVPGAVDDLDVERLRLRAELARVEWARGRALADKPAAAQVQWQLGFLSDELQHLREETLRSSSPAVHIYPTWRY